MTAKPIDLTGEPASAVARKVETDLGTDRGSVVARGLDIRTLDQALAESKVDMEAWQVDRHVVNSWEVTIGGSQTKSGEPETFTNYQVKVWLKRRVPAPLEEAIAKATDRLLRGRPPCHRPPRTKLPRDILLEVALYDAHFGKLAWRRETGTDYDLKIAEAIYQHAVEDLLGRVAGWPVGEILFPVGNDFLHAQNDEAQTPRGKNHLDTDGRLAKAFEAGILAVARAVDSCLTVAPVRLVWVPGNHDPQASYFLAKVLEARYAGRKGVVVDVGLNPRKYHRHGTCLLGMTHGSDERHRDLPLIMAGEQAEAWAETTCREWHIGHLHQRRQTVHLAGETVGPVMVRILPSLSASDAWHHTKGYVGGPRAAEAYLWSASGGYVGHFSVDARP
jgi:hypothetical protein